jgi:signal transduction histidine kinase
MSAFMLVNWLVNVPHMGYIVVAPVDPGLQRWESRAIVCGHFLTIFFGACGHTTSSPGLFRLFVALAVISATAGPYNWYRAEALCEDMQAQLRSRQQQHRDDAARAALVRTLAVHQRQRVLATVVTVLFPVFPIVYFLRTAGHISDDVTVVAFQVTSTVAKVLFSNLCMDAHLEDARISTEPQLQAEEAIRRAARWSLLRWLFHEVRGALNAVTMSSDLLANSLHNGQRKNEHDRNELTHPETDRIEALQQIQRSSAQISETLHNAQTLQCIEDGSFALEQQALSPADVLAQVHAQVETAARAAGVGVTVSIAAGVPGAVLGDSFVLWSVLVHLVSNAVRFSHRGESVTVLAAVQTENGQGSRLTRPADHTGRPSRKRALPATLRS